MRSTLFIVPLAFAGLAAAQVDGLLSTVEDGYNGTTETIGEAAESGLDAARSLATGAFTTFESVVDGATQTIVSAFGEVSGSLATDAASHVESVYDSLTEAAAATSAVGSLAGVATEKVAGAAETATGALGSVAGEATKAIGDGIDKAGDAIKGIFDNAAPSAYPPSHFIVLGAVVAAGAGAVIAA
ncbi:hypothetical protein Rhopal_005451-T1 [Rhodotorula paludigena]|uniref:Uncharacterized protein n=1 Tax=Rhodotorula paludigena TaxID=86838 RepID=A0AAV5GIQ1_9BASI|nr:hypothetical protein Rhopal_005451-T1 [Rhodotorula paludigena]